MKPAACHTLAALGWIDSARNYTWFIWYETAVFLFKWRFLVYFHHICISGCLLSNTKLTFILVLNRNSIITTLLLQPVSTHSIVTVIWVSYSVSWSVALSHDTREIRYLVTFQSHFLSIHGNEDISPFFSSYYFSCPSPVKLTFVHFAILLRILPFWQDLENWEQLWRRPCFRRMDYLWLLKPKKKPSSRSFCY